MKILHMKWRPCSIAIIFRYDSTFKNFQVVLYILKRTKVLLHFGSFNYLTVMPILNIFLKGRVNPKFHKISALKLRRKYFWRPQSTEVKYCWVYPYTSWYLKSGCVRGVSMNGACLWKIKPFSRQWLIHTLVFETQGFYFNVLIKPNQTKQKQTQPPRT